MSVIYLNEEKISFRKEMENESPKSFFDKYEERLRECNIHGGLKALCRVALIKAVEYFHSETGGGESFFIELFDGSEERHQQIMNLFQGGMPFVMNGVNFTGFGIDTPNNDDLKDCDTYLESLIPSCARKAHEYLYY